MIKTSFAIATAALMALVAVPAQAALTANAITANALTANAITANALTANALTANALISNGLSSLGHSREGTPSSTVRFAIDGIELPASAR